MNKPIQAPDAGDRKVGRPRRGTEAARTTALMNAATRVFLRDGYGSASVDKVATEAGVSTRTIYERYRNKADLLAAVIGRLVHRLAMVLATAELDRLEPRRCTAADRRDHLRARPRSGLRCPLPAGRHGGKPVSRSCCAYAGK